MMKKNIAEKMETMTQTRNDRIDKDFFAFTKYTCPHGFEKDLYAHLLEPYSGIWREGIGYEVQVGESNGILFTSHLDTAGYSKLPIKVKRQLSKGNIVGTDGQSILGADDKAGVALMLHMIRAEVAGTYIFYEGEEKGMIGSSAHVASYSAKPYPYTQVVSLDRAGYHDIITHQSGSRTCSDTYAEGLRAQLDRVGMFYGLSELGAWTDSYAHNDVALECTNLSVGYARQHTHNEVQDLTYLKALGDALVMIDWENLPVTGFAEEDKYNWGSSWSMRDYKYYDSPSDDGNTTLSDILAEDKNFTWDELYEFCVDHPDDAASALEILVWRRING